MYSGKYLSLKDISTRYNPAHLVATERQQFNYAVVLHHAICGFVAAVINKCSTEGREDAGPIWKHGFETGDYKIRTLAVWKTVLTNFILMHQHYKHRDSFPHLYQRNSIIVVIVVVVVAIMIIIIIVQNYWTREGWKIHRLKAKEKC